MTAPDAKPWEAEGISRATWYRRQRETPAGTDETRETRRRAPIEPEDVVGTAEIEGTVGELAAWANANGQIVVAWSGYGWSVNEFPMLIDLPTAGRLVTRVRALASDIIETTRAELCAVSST